MKKRSNTESALSCAVAGFLEIALPDGSVFTHIPLGGYRDPRTAARLRAEGVRPGAPDFMVVVPPEGFRTANKYATILFIELKVGANQLSKPQAQWRDLLLCTHAVWAMCRSLDDVVEKLNMWGVKLKAKIASTCPISHHQ